MMMTSRERVLTACRRGRPDRVPRQFPMLGEVHALIRTELGIDNPHAWLGDDCDWVGWKASWQATDFRHYFDRPDMEWDEWGRGRVWDAQRHYAEYFYPLQDEESLEAIGAYPWPDLDQSYRFEHCSASVAASHDRDRPVVAGMQETIFEIAWQVRSMERLFTDMVFAPELAAAVLDPITSLRVAAARHLAAAGADILSLGDDVAMQTGLLMSKATWRQWLGPRLKAVIDAAKAVKPDILIHYHSDGAITDLIPDLIEAGVEILNPMQPECVDHAWVKQHYGDRLAFWGGLGVQSVLPFGTPEQVRTHVKEVLADLGADGGLVIAPSHVLETDTPVANIVAMREAIEECGGYD